MRIDEDIKIAGDKPSQSLKNDMLGGEIELDNTENIEKVKIIGQKVAEQFLLDTNITDDENFNNVDLLLQRRVLLSFAVTVGFETYFSHKGLSDVAKKSFLDTLKADSEEVYRTSSDTGAFSFYYLAYRRGDDTERRIGQTFAMLCSHDGDPIFQELGETLYCWFLSVVKRIINENN